MISFLLRLGLSAVTLFVVANASHGAIAVDNWTSALTAVFFISILNALVKPILMFVAGTATCALSCLTLGLWSLVLSWLLNGLIFFWAADILPGFSVKTFWAAMLGSLALSAVNAFASALGGDSKGKTKMLVEKGVHETRQLIVITGLSGAGKGLAARHFEDFGFFCVDNLPPQLMPMFAELCERGQVGRAAMVVDVRGGEWFNDLDAALEALEHTGLDFRILFLDADDDALLKRFKETRRKHPLDEGEIGLSAAIEKEREALVSLKERADKIINTSHVKPRELREEIKRTFVDEGVTQGLLIQVESFGFKHGPPADADLVFDVRFLPNPNYDRDIGHLDGFCEPVIDYVMREEVTQKFLEKLEDFVGFCVPEYEKEGKAYLTIAIGCTGGRHRSVCLANWLAQRLKEQGYRAQSSHRDLARHAPQVDAKTPAEHEASPAIQPPSGQQQTFEAGRAGGKPK